MELSCSSPFEPELHLNLLNSLQDSFQYSNGDVDSIDEQHYSDSPIHEFTNPQWLLWII